MTGGDSSSQKSSGGRIPLVSIKVFEGLDKAVSQTVVVASNNFHANPMPTNLKKMSIANQSFERYLHHRTKSDRSITKSSEMQNHRTVTSEDYNGAS